MERTEQILTILGAISLLYGIFKFQSMKKLNELHATMFGKKVIVYYNPENPNDAVTQKDSDYFLYIAIGILMFVSKIISKKYIG